MNKGKIKEKHFVCPHNKPPYNLTCMKCDEWSGGVFGYCELRYKLTGEKF